MSEDPDRRTRGQVPDTAAAVYEEFFVRALFGQWVTPMLDRAGVRSGQIVLDVGCGTGIVARRAADRVGDRGRVIGIDPNDGMLAVARERAPGLDWRSGVAESIPLPDDLVDRTICQFAAMFFTDSAAALDEMMRVTRPGGRIALATWASIDRSPGYHAMVGLLADEVGDWAAEALAAPFTIGTEDEMHALIGQRGHRVDTETMAGIATFPSIDAWLHTDIRGWTLADDIDDERYAALLLAARSGLKAFEAADGTVSFDAPAIIATIDV